MKLFFGLILAIFSFSAFAEPGAPLEYFDAILKSQAFKEEYAKLTDSTVNGMSHMDTLRCRGCYEFSIVVTGGRVGQKPDTEEWKFNTRADEKGRITVTR